MKLLTEKEYINIKVRISNLINLFTTGRIRKKDMPLYNEHLNYVIDFIDDTIESKQILFKTEEDGWLTQEALYWDFIRSIDMVQQYNLWCEAIVIKKQKVQE